MGSLAPDEKFFQSEIFHGAERARSSLAAARRARLPLSRRRDSAQM
jgi:hypothetical protein